MADPGDQTRSAVASISISEATGVTVPDLRNRLTLPPIPRPAGNAASAQSSPSSGGGESWETRINLSTGKSITLASAISRSNNPSGSSGDRERIQR